MGDERRRCPGGSCNASREPRVLLGRVHSGLVLAVVLGTQTEAFAEAWERGRAEGSAQVATCVVRVDGSYIVQARALGVAIPADGCIRLEDTGMVLGAYSRAAQERDAAIATIGVTTGERCMVTAVISVVTSGVIPPDLSACVAAFIAPLA